MEKFFKDEVIFYNEGDNNMLKKIISPILFQGNLKKKNYFEGWYYKQVSKDEKSIISLIPGISLFENQCHSFVQFIFSTLDKDNNRIVKSGYLKYSLEDFKFNNDPFMVKIGDNTFSESHVSIKLMDKKNNIQGTFELGTLKHIEKSILMPNIMGFFSYLPKMECNHGVISMIHAVNGKLMVNGEEINFNGGKGYIEKDRGTSFPKEYLWIQCNSFKNKTVSIFSSVAKLPYINMNFMGHVSNLLIDGKQYRFATYNNSKLKIEKLTSENIKLSLENSKLILNIEAILSNSVELIAPQNGNMKKTIKEEPSGMVKLNLYNKKNKTVYEDIGVLAGIEIVGFKELNQ